MHQNKIETYRIILQNCDFEDIKNKISRKHITFKKNKTSITISQNKIVSNVIVSLIISGNPLPEMTKLENAQFLDECIVGERHSKPIYYLPGIHNQIPTVCNNCWNSMCIFSEQVCMKIGKTMFEQRRKKLLLFEKSELLTLIDRDSIRFIYFILMYRI